MATGEEVVLQTRVNRWCWMRA